MKIQIFLLLDKRLVVLASKNLMNNTFFFSFNQDRTFPRKKVNLLNNYDAN